MSLCRGSGGVDRGQLTEVAASLEIGYDEGGAGPSRGLALYAAHTKAIEVAAATMPVTTSHGRCSAVGRPRVCGGV